MEVDAPLKIQDERVILAGHYLPVLGRQPFGIRLGLCSVGFAGPGIDRAVGHNIFAVKGVPSLQNQAVRRASHDEC